MIKAQCESAFYLNTTINIRRFFMNETRGYYDLIRIFRSLNTRSRVPFVMGHLL